MYIRIYTTHSNRTYTHLDGLVASIPTTLLFSLHIEHHRTDKQTSFKSRAFPENFPAASTAGFHQTIQLRAEKYVPLFIVLLYKRGDG